jgi:hypothetical protein
MADVDRLTSIWRRRVARWGDTPLVAVDAPGQPEVLVPAGRGDGGGRPLAGCRRAGRDVDPQLRRQRRLDWLPNAVTDITPRRSSVME